MGLPLTIAFSSRQRFALHADQHCASFALDQAEDAYVVLIPSRNQVLSHYYSLSVASKLFEDTVALRTASGEIELVGSPILVSEFATVLRPPTPKTVLVDLSGVSFLDSAGVRALIDAHKGAVAVSPPSDLRANRAVSRPMGLTGVTEFLEIYDARAAARPISKPASSPRQ
jgi:anti-sigma B factor antagonist